MKKQTSVTELKQFITRKERLIEKHRTELMSARQKLLDVCQHESTHVRETYYAGDYYTRASTEYTTVCNICGTTTANRTETQSYYG